MKKFTPTPNSILAPFSPLVRQLSNDVRAMMQAEVPEAIERAYPGWNAIGFRDKEAGYFCGLFPQADSVRLIFEFGAFLDDPSKILEGDQAQIRSYSVCKPADLKKPALRVMFREAVSYGRKRRKKKRKQPSVAKKSGMKVTKRQRS